MRIRKAPMVIAALAGVAPAVCAAEAPDAAQLYRERTCVACHGAEGRTPVMDEYPRVAGLSAGYLLTQMRAIKSGERANSHSLAMKNVMHLVSDEEMEAIAVWLAGLSK